jgi:RHS repeat-associated protein
MTSANGTKTTLGYDQANHLTSISGGTSYTYDGDGLRMSKTVSGTTTRFAWDESGSLPLLLQDGDAYYIYGPGGQPIEQITGDNPTYLLQDQQGSTRLLTDGSGNVVGTYSYDAWGNVTDHMGAATTNLQYNGQYTDAETGFQYLRARYYDPATGQFLTVDPAVSETLAPYSYTNDDPLNYGDASGLRLAEDPSGIATTVIDTNNAAIDMINTAAAGIGTPIVCALGSGGQCYAATQETVKRVSQLKKDVPRVALDYLQLPLKFPLIFIPRQLVEPYQTAPVEASISLPYGYGKSGSAEPVMVGGHIRPITPLCELAPVEQQHL